jgi:DNA-binding XRE family transcriptional regulator
MGTKQRKEIQPSSALPASFWRGHLGETAKHHVACSRIREIRLQRGLSQEELTELADLHRNCAGGMERGEHNVSFINIVKIAPGLNARRTVRFDDVERPQCGARRNLKDAVNLGV